MKDDDIEVFTSKISRESISLSDIGDIVLVNSVKYTGSVFEGTSDNYIISAVREDKYNPRFSFNIEGYFIFNKIIVRDTDKHEISSVNLTKFYSLSNTILYLDVELSLIGNIDNSITAWIMDFEDHSKKSLFKLHDFLGLVARDLYQSVNQYKDNLTNRINLENITTFKYNDYPNDVLYQNGLANIIGDDITVDNEGNDIEDAYKLMDRAPRIFKSFSYSEYANSQNIFGIRGTVPAFQITKDEFNAGLMFANYFYTNVSMGIIIPIHKKGFILFRYEFADKLWKIVLVKCDYVNLTTQRIKPEFYEYTLYSKNKALAEDQSEYTIERDTDFLGNDYTHVQENLSTNYCVTRWLFTIGPITYVLPYQIDNVNLNGTHSTLYCALVSENNEPTVLSQVKNNTYTNSLDNLFNFMDDDLNKMHKMSNQSVPFFDDEYQYICVYGISATGSNNNLFSNSKILPTQLSSDNGVFFTKINDKKIPIGYYTDRRFSAFIEDAINELISAAQGANNSLIKKSELKRLIYDKIGNDFELNNFELIMPDKATERFVYSIDLDDSGAKVNDLDIYDIYYKKWIARLGYNLDNIINSDKTISEKQGYLDDIIKELAIKKGLSDTERDYYNFYITKLKFSINNNNTDNKLEGTFSTSRTYDIFDLIFKDTMNGGQEDIYNTLCKSLSISSGSIFNRANYSNNSGYLSTTYINKSDFSDYNRFKQEINGLLDTTNPDDYLNEDYADLRAAYQNYKKLYTVDSNKNIVINKQKIKEIFNDETEKVITPFIVLTIPAAQTITREDGTIEEVQTEDGIVNVLANPATFFYVEKDENLTELYVNNDSFVKEDISEDYWKITLDKKNDKLDFLNSITKYIPDVKTIRSLVSNDFKDKSIKLGYAYVCDSLDALNRLSSNTEADAGLPIYSTGDIRKVMDNIKQDGNEENIEIDMLSLLDSINKDNSWPKPYYGKPGIDLDWLTEYYKDYICMDYNSEGIEANKEFITVIDDGKLVAYHLGKINENLTEMYPRDMLDFNSQLMETRRSLPVITSSSNNEYTLRFSNTRLLRYLGLDYFNQSANMQLTNGNYYYMITDGFSYSLLKLPNSSLKTNESYIRLMISLANTVLNDFKDCPNLQLKVCDEGVLVVDTDSFDDVNMIYYYNGYLINDSNTQITSFKYPLPKSIKNFCVDESDGIVYIYYYTTDINNMKQKVINLDTHIEKTLRSKLYFDKFNAGKCYLDDMRL